MNLYEKGKRSIDFLYCRSNISNICRNWLRLRFAHHQVAYIYQPVWSLRRQPGASYGGCMQRLCRVLQIQYWTKVSALLCFVRWHALFYRASPPFSVLIVRMAGVMFLGTDLVSRNRNEARYLRCFSFVGLARRWLTKYLKLIGNILLFSSRPRSITVC
jgi:hypothetical protein